MLKLKGGMSNITPFFHGGKITCDTAKLQITPHSHLRKSKLVRGVIFVFCLTHRHNIPKNNDKQFVPAWVRLIFKEIATSDVVLLAMTQNLIN